MALKLKPIAREGNGLSFFWPNENQMKFWEYVLARYAARKVERGLDTAVKSTASATKSLFKDAQFPTLGKSIAMGIFVGLGLLVWTGIVGAITQSTFWSKATLSVFTFPFVVDLLLQRSTHGFKKVPVKVKDRRFKEGYRVEHKLEPDHELRVSKTFSVGFYNLVW